MRMLLFAGALLGATMLAGTGFAQTTTAPTEAACPEGQGRGGDGTCTVMPATPHQMNVLKPDASPAGAATGTAAPGTGTQQAVPGTEMPATKHQQEVLKKEGGG